LYNNAEKKKAQILIDNKGLCGLYLWTIIETGKRYVGSTVNLSNQLEFYFSSLTLKRVNNYISRALINHGHPVFSLAILLRALVAFIL